MTIVQRYHFSVRRASNTIRKEAPDSKTEDASEMAAIRIIDSAGPDRPVPTILVLVALPCLGLSKDGHTPSTFLQAVALGKAVAAMLKRFTSRQVRDELRTTCEADVMEA